jgi:hypothetical protein
LGYLLIFFHQASVNQGMVDLKLTCEIKDVVLPAKTRHLS